MTHIVLLRILDLVLKICMALWFPSLKTFVVALALQLSKLVILFCASFKVDGVLGWGSLGISAHFTSHPFSGAVSEYEEFCLLHIELLSCFGKVRSVLALVSSLQFISFPWFRHTSSSEDADLITSMPLLLKLWLLSLGWIWFLLFLYGFVWIAGVYSCLLGLFVGLGRKDVHNYLYPLICSDSFFSTFNV